VRRIPSLDGLRAVSISLVVLGHLAKSGHAPQVFWSYFSTTGVRIFFVISGYLITTLLVSEYECTSTVSLRAFYVRRAFRIFPAATVFMAAMVIFYGRDLNLYHVLGAVFYLANYDMTRPWIFGHLWSLSIEEQFYLLWPSVLKKFYKHRIGILIAVMALAPVWQTVSYLLKWRVGLVAFPAMAGNLAIGCLLAVISHRVPRVGRVSALIMTAAIILIPFFPAQNHVRTLLMLFVLNPVLYASIAGVLLHVVQRPYAWLNWGPTVWLGRISYSLYLWQQPFCSDPHLRSGYFAIFAFLCAVISYEVVERPMLRLRERFSLIRPRLLKVEMPRSEASVDQSVA
jgi:peptidoglycan/LPS O-acetylase OafA/YrhL